MNDEQVAKVIAVLKQDKKYAEDQAKRGDDLDIYYEGRAAALDHAIALIKVFSES